MCAELYFYTGTADGVCLAVQRSTICLTKGESKALLNTQEGNLTMDIASIVIFFLARALL